MNQYYGCMKKVIIKSKVDIKWNLDSEIIIFSSYIEIVITLMLSNNSYAEME